MENFPWWLIPAIMGLSIPLIGIISSIFTSKDSVIGQAIAHRLEARAADKSRGTNENTLELEKRVEALEEEVRFLNHLLSDKSQGRPSPPRSGAAEDPLSNVDY